MSIPLPDSPDGYATDPWGTFVRVGADLRIRCTDDVGGYRVLASTPSDLLGPTNDSATVAPSNNLICDKTGFRVPVAEGLKEEWDGSKVRARSWEPRHPLDYARPMVSDKLKGSERPERPDVFRTTPVTLDDLDP